MLIILVSGCSTMGTPAQESVHQPFRDMIKEWQMRIQREGWSESQVHSILFDFRTLVTYNSKALDHWDTPKEFIQKGFSGDCLDIAVFMMGTLKRLGYPYRIKIVIVKALIEGHALLRVEMADGGWRIYDVVPRSIPNPRIGLIRPVVEFDDRQASWFPPKSGTPFDPDLLARASGKSELSARTDG